MTTKRIGKDFTAARDNQVKMSSDLAAAHQLRLCGMAFNAARVMLKHEKQQGHKLQVGAVKREYATKGYGVRQLH